MLCFFFKQKTAYEMRISDWSSDVCSSDLPVERRRIGEIIAVVMRDGDIDLLARVIGGGEQRLAVLDRQRHGAADEVEPGVAHQRARVQPIGRASGWERGWQYV